MRLIFVGGRKLCDWVKRLCVLDDDVDSKVLNLRVCKGNERVCPSKESSS